MARWKSLGCILAGVLLAATAYFLQADVPVKPAASPETAAVQQGPLVLEATLKGVFESPEMTEVLLRPEAGVLTSGPLTILKAVAHGAAVKKGDWLLSIDPAPLDRALRDLEVEQQLTEVTVAQAAKDLAVLEKSVPQEVQAAERAKTIAEEDLKRFLNAEKALAVKMAHLDLQSAQFGLEYVKDNLRQLEKMYREKDLTEDTEQIILKRERRGVERAAFGLEAAKQRHDKTLRIDLPRKEVDLAEAAAKAALALEKATSTLPATLALKRQALAKSRYDRDKGVEKLKRLRADRKSLEVTAPADGLVYYGRCVQGQWTTTAEVARKMHRGGVLAPEEVFMTLVQPRPLFVRAVVEEKDLPLVGADKAARITALALPGRKLPAKVEQVSAVPLAPGTFEARLVVEWGAGTEAIVPGMTCIAHVVAYRKADALTLPTAAVFEDDAEEDKFCVFVATSGKPVKRVVDVGRRSADRVEILAGVRVGERVLLSHP